MSTRVTILPQLSDEVRSGEIQGAAARAVLVKVEIGAWGGTKSIKTLKRAMAEEAQADARLLSAGKRIGRAKGHLDQIHKLRGAIRNWVAKNTVPWGDSGWRLIGTEVSSSGRSAYRRWQQYMDEAKISWDREVRDFLKAYPDLIEADKATKTGLGELFDESDYPPIKDEYGQAIADRFFFDKDHMRKVDEVPDGAIAIGLSRDEEQRIRNRCEEDIAGAYRHAQRDLVTKVVKLTTDTADALKGYDPDKKGKRFFNDSLVPNLQDLAQCMKESNFNNNPEIDALREKLLEATGDATEVLREDTDKRKDAADTTSEVSERASKLLSEIWGK
jgi:hypothetical protein